MTPPPGASILVVDDDPVFRDVLGRAFRRRGLRVREADGVETALAAIAAEAPRFAVVDLKLADGSGLAVVARLHEKYAPARSVVLTGYASITTAVAAVKLGATNYLTKPATPAETLRALDAAVPDPGVPDVTEPPSVERVEWEHIQRVLADHGDNISATARALNMHRRTLQRKLAKRPVKK